MSRSPEYCGFEFAIKRVAAPRDMLVRPYQNKRRFIEVGDGGLTDLGNRKLR